MFIDSICMVILGVYFYFVKSMQALMIIMIVLNVILIVLIWYGVPESPKFLYEKHRKDEFIQALQWIAKVNRIDPQLDQLMALEKRNEIELSQMQREDVKEEEEDEIDGNISPTTKGIGRSMKVTRTANLPSE